MSNLVALLAHTRPGEEIIAGAGPRLYYEVGGLAGWPGCCHG